MKLEVRVARSIAKRKSIVVQRSELVELLNTGDDLLRRLASQADKLTI